MASTELLRWWATHPQYTDIQITVLGGAICVALEVNYVPAGTVVLEPASFTPFMLGLCLRDKPAGISLALSNGQVRTVFNVPKGSKYLMDATGELFEPSDLKEVYHDDVLC